jgi:hypothetical protein
MVFVVLLRPSKEMSGNYLHSATTTSFQTVSNPSIIPLLNPVWYSYWQPRAVVRKDGVVSVLNSLSTMPRRNMGGVEVQLHSLLAYLRDGATGSHWIGGWVNPIGSLYPVE